MEVTLNSVQNYIVFGGRGKFKLHNTVLIIKPTRCTNFSHLFFE